MNTIYDIEELSNGYLDSKEFKAYGKLLERLCREKPITLAELRRKLGGLELPNWTVDALESPNIEIGGSVNLPTYFFKKLRELKTIPHKDSMGKLRPPDSKYPTAAIHERRYL